MKRFLLLLLAILTAFSCFACADKSEEPADESEKTKDIDVFAEAEAIVEKYSLSSGTVYTSDENPLDEDMIRSLYGDATAMPDFSQVEAYSVYLDETNLLKPCEFGIFKMKDGADAETFIAFLKARVDMKLRNASAYPDIDTATLKSAKFTVKGNYLWYCVVKDANDEINSDLEGKL